MLRYSPRLFVAAIIAAFLGFGGVAGEATGIARVLFVIFAAVFAISLFFGVVTAAMKGPE